MRMRIPSLIFIVALLVGLPPAHGQIVFSNDFETGTSGFVASGSLTGLTRVSLPTDSVGMGSSNQSMWLGKLGDGVAKSGSSDEIVTLSLSGLTAGNLHSVSFDLLIGASWDGAAGGYGPDSWRFTVDGTRLVDTIFSDWTGSNFGAYSPQRYTDTSYTSPSGPDVAGFTGSDAHWTANAGGNYANDYAIYYFGHGVGNPVLTFIASGTTTSLEFARYGATTDSPDEYWALDNVVVAAIPEPAVCAIWVGLGGLAFAGWRRRRAVDCVSGRQYYADHAVLVCAKFFPNLLRNDARCHTPDHSDELAARCG